MHEISTHQGSAPSWAFAKASGGEWHRQRDVDDPKGEAEAGIDFDTDCDDQSAEDFLKALDSDEECDETGAHLKRCGLHLCKAKLAHMAGDHAQVGRSINSAMSSYSKFHAGLKSAMED